MLIKTLNTHSDYRQTERRTDITTGLHIAPFAFTDAGRINNLLCAHTHRLYMHRTEPHKCGVQLFANFEITEKQQRSNYYICNGRFASKLLLKLKLHASHWSNLHNVPVIHKTQR